MLLELGVLRPPPAIQPDIGVAQTQDDSAIVVIDGGGVQHVISAEWTGERWESRGEIEGAFLPDGEELVFRRVSVSAADGFAEDALLLIGRVPNGPINQLDITVGGEVQRFPVGNRPVVVMAFPPGTVIGDRFTTIDARTRVLGAGVVLDAEE